MNKPRQYKVTGTFTSYTYVSMWQGASHMLEIAKREEEGQLYTCTSALFYAAFMLEAYFNHIGREQHGEGWNNMERNLPKLKKFEKFAKEAGWDARVKLSQRPYSSLKEIFAFRDALAHGKTIVNEEVEIVIENKESISSSLPGPNWHTVAMLENTVKLCEDAVSIVSNLHKALGFGERAFTSSGNGVYFASDLD